MRARSPGLPLLAALAVALCAAGAFGYWLTAGRAPESLPPASLETSVYRVAVDRWRLPGGTRRPSLGIHGDLLLLSSNDGTLHRASLPRPGRDAPLAWTELPFAIPVEMAILERKQGPEWGYALGVRDIYLHGRPDGAVDLYVLYGVYVSDGDCVVTRVARVAAFLGQGPGAPIETIYDVAPCLPFGQSLDRVGGRLAMRDGQLLVVLGSPQEDRLFQQPGDLGKAWAQRSDRPFGKLLQIDPDSRAVRQLAAGLRNPQGLAVAADGRVWITDHGPRGGDELNLLREGADYGWPAVSYGTAYSRFTWPASTQPGRHAGFERPVYAWVPSVGISQLLQLEDAAFGRWQGDLLITSLNGNTLYRTRVEEGRVVFAEPIPFGHRLRDIAAASGSIYIVTDFDLLLRLAPDYARD